MATSPTTDAEELPAAARPTAPDSTGSFGVILEVVREMREQRNAFERSAELAAKERKSERRWRNLFQALFFGAPVVLGILYFLFFLNTAGFRWGPFGNVVGVVRHYESALASVEMERLFASTAVYKAGVYANSYALLLMPLTFVLGNFFVVVMAGLGLSFLSLHTMGLELRSGLLALLDIRDAPVMRMWNVVHLSSKLLSPAAEAFRYFMLEQAEAHLLAHDAPLLGR